TTVARTITLDHEMIVLDELGQATTLNLTINADVEIGAEIWLKSSCGTTAYDITLGTGTDEATITGVASKTQYHNYYHHQYAAQLLPVIPFCYVLLKLLFLLNSCVQFSHSPCHQQ
ncbi:unnamed protein product, partial [marine sediment metagenome]